MIRSKEELLKKKTVAREWVFFLGSLCAGIIVLPPLLVSIFRGRDTISEIYIELGGCLLGQERYFLECWMFILSPYLVLQLIRSIIWAVKTLRQG